jgi:integrase
LNLPTPTVNGSPLSRRNLLNRQLKPTCKILGLTGVYWHWFRHAHATLLDSAGAPVGTTQALLGHLFSGIIRDTYIHSVPAEARRVVGDVEKLGTKWAQVPIQPEMSNSINWVCA